MFEDLENQRSGHNIVDNFERVNIDNGHSSSSPRWVLMNTVARDYKNLRREDIDNITKEIVSSYKSQEIRLGDKTLYSSYPELADSIEQNINTISVADRIERNNNNTSIQEEYFRWIEESRIVIKELNDGLVEQKELERRDDFLKDLKQRETELLVCLGLYSSSNSKYAQEKYAELSRKLYKLREVRNVVHATTSNKKIGYENPEKEKKRVEKYITPLSVIRKAKKDAAEEWSSWIEINRNLAVLKNPDILHQDTALLSGRRSKNFDREVENYWRLLVYEINAGKYDSYAEKMVMENRGKTKADIIRSISWLRGIKSEAEKRKEMDDRINKIKDRMKRIMFDRERYMLLNEDEENYKY